jgi:hypothetical protein
MFRTFWVRSAGPLLKLKLSADQPSHWILYRVSQRIGVHRCRRRFLVANWVPSGPTGVSCAGSGTTDTRKMTSAKNLLLFCIHFSAFYTIPNDLFA